MTDLDLLFIRRGIDEPIRPCGLGQTDADYVAGREAFLFCCDYKPPVENQRAHIYFCGWNHERLETQAEARRLQP